VNSPLAGDDGDARSRGALGGSIPAAGAGSTPASRCGPERTAGAGAAVSAGESAGCSTTGRAPVGALSVGPAAACSPDDSRLARSPFGRRSSARRSERRGVRPRERAPPGVRPRERAARGVRPLERAARRLLPAARRRAARGRSRRARAGALPTGLGSRPGVIFIPSRAVTPASSGSGAAASSPQLRPSVAISVPAASSAASRPTFPHRTRRRSAGAPRARRRSTPG
jgi:hypothetical protein